MVAYKITERAYAKMIFHAAKYPHLSVNGVLLAEKSSGSTTVQLVDAIPMFHQCLYVSPMAEIALMQIDSYAESENLVIAGYYSAAENFNDNTIERAPASGIADRIQDNHGHACFVIIDNTLMSLTQEEPGLSVFTCSDHGRWIKATYSLQQNDATLDTVSALLKRGAMRDVVDFDNYLDNPENDWTNQFLNKDLTKIMAMY